MNVHIQLQGIKGEVKDIPFAHIQLDLPNATSLSDAAQQLPHMVLIRRGCVFGFYGMCPNEKAHFIFRLKIQQAIDWS